MATTYNVSYLRTKFSDKTIFAVIRAIEIIGEAVKSIPEDARKECPEIRACPKLRDLDLVIIIQVCY